LKIIFSTILQLKSLSINEDVIGQVQAFEHLIVLSALSICFLEWHLPAETFPVNFLERLKALELGLVNEIVIIFINF
jgi:hypothetical protein